MTYRVWVPVLFVGWMAAAGTTRLEASVADTVGARAADAAATGASLQLQVDVAARKLIVYQDGAQIREFDVAVGKPDHPTPTGAFSVKRVIWNPSWVPPRAPWARGKKARQPGDPQNPMGRAKIFFLAPDYYIHGTNDDASIGTAASHGCIRMRNEEVVELARMLMEHGGAERPESWFARVLNRVRSTQDVKLARPIPVEIRG